MSDAIESGIEISIESRVRTAVDVAGIERAIALTLRSEEIGHAQIEVHIVGDKAMRAYNVEYLDHDYTTDVLSFELGQDPIFGLTGMLIICRPFAARSAKSRGISEAEELVRYAIHGTLHLLGYDDHEPADYERMWSAQEKLVAQALAHNTRARSKRGG